MSGKYRDPLDLLLSFGITLEYGCGRFMGRNVRYLEHSGVFEVGEDDKTFDRWANSSELLFDLRSPKGQRRFKRWATDLRRTRK